MTENNAIGIRLSIKTILDGLVFFRYCI